MIWASQRRRRHGLLLPKKNDEAEAGRQLRCESLTQDTRCHAWVMLTPALAIGAALVALAFAALTFERWLVRRLPQDLAWAVALTLFVAGALALAWGSAVGWSPLTFRLFYGFGAVINVPFLAAGQLYLLIRRKLAQRIMFATSCVACFAFGIVLASPLKAQIPRDRLPQGSEVFGAGPRILAAVGSGLSASVIFVGTAIGVVRMVKAGLAARSHAETIPRFMSRLAGLVLLAAGTVVLSLSGTLNSRLGEMRAFAVTLTAGVTLLFAGFALSSLKAHTDARWLTSDS